MTNIKLPVQKEEVKFEAYSEWNVIDSADIIRATSQTEQDADAIVAALNERERMREALQDVSNDIAAHFSALELVTDESLAGSWKDKLDTALKEPDHVE